MASFRIEQWIDNHDQHAKNRKHQLRQNAHVVRSLRQRSLGQRSLHLCQKTGQRMRERANHAYDRGRGSGQNHWPTTLVSNCLTGGASATCTAGSIALSHSKGATPITKATTAIGQSAACSRRLRSGSVLLTSCVTLP